MQNKQISLEVVKIDQQQQIKLSDDFEQTPDQTAQAKIYTYRIFKKIKLLEKQSDNKAVEQLMRIIEISPSKKIVHLAVKTLGKNPTSAAAYALFHLFYQSTDYSMQLHIAEALQGHKNDQEVIKEIEDIIKIIPNNSLKKIFKDIIAEETTSYQELFDKISLTDRLDELQLSYERSNYAQFIQQLMTLLEETKEQSATKPADQNKEIKRRAILKKVFEGDNALKVSVNPTITEKFKLVNDHLRNQQQINIILRSVNEKMEDRVRQQLIQDQVQSEIKEYEKAFQEQLDRVSEKQKSLEYQQKKEVIKNYIKDFTFVKNEYAEEIVDPAINDLDNELLLETFWEMLSERTTRYKIALSLGLNDLFHFGEDLVKSNWYGASKSLTKKVWQPFHKALKRKSLFSSNYALFIMHNIYLQALKGKNTAYENLVKLFSRRLLRDSNSAAEYNNKKAKIEAILVDIEAILQDSLEKQGAISIQKTEMIKRALQLTRDIYNILDNFHYYEGQEPGAA